MQVEKLIVKPKLTHFKNIIAVKKTNMSFNDMFDDFSNSYERGIRRTYNHEGGKTRSEKGKIGVQLANKMINYAAIKAGLDMSKLRIVNEHKFFVPFFNMDYVNNRELDTTIANTILENHEDYSAKYSVDLAVFYDGVFILGVEAKAYTDTTMFKRFLNETKAIKTYLYPTACFAVLQLENGLGGDYGEDKDIYTGSTTAHSLMSVDNIYIEIRTLLDGNRNSSHPIHNEEYYKPLNKYKFFSTLNAFTKILIKQASINHIKLN